jgi:uncharacterized membrane protein
MSPPGSPEPSSKKALTSHRFDRLDALRGFALVWMAAFHFCFDLSHAGLLQANFYADPLWTTQRTFILSIFLLCAGAGQAIATAQGQSLARFWKRWGQIVACALAVSAGSWWMFPHSYIYFGVLHGMAVMLLIARLSAPKGAWLWPLGALVLSLPLWLSHPWFDTRLTSILGLVTHKPITEDFVPLVPWLGVMWWGLAATQWLLRKHPQWLSSARPCGARLAQPQRALSWLGQWSLTFYMVHQPLLLGALELYLMTRRTA